MSYWYASNFIFNITRNNWTPLCLYCHFGQIAVWFWLLKWEQHAVSVTSQSWMFSYGTVFWKDQGATAFYLVSEWINTFLPHALKSYAFHFQSIGLRPSLRSFNIPTKKLLVFAITTDIILQLSVNWLKPPWSRAFLIAPYLSVNAFSTKVISGNTILTPSGEGTAILHGHLSQC